MGFNTISSFLTIIVACVVEIVSSVEADVLVFSVLADV